MHAYLMCHLSTLLLLVLCCDSDSGECMEHVHIVDIVNIPTSISVKWESDPQCPPSDISSATHTGSNEFELDGLPLGQVGSVCGDGKVL